MRSRKMLNGWLFIRASLLLISPDRSANAFVPSLRHDTISLRPSIRSQSLSFSNNMVASARSADLTQADMARELTKREIRQLVRREGGLFAFNTKFGALNPFAIYYGLVAILLGIPWYCALTLCQIFYFLTGNKIDKNRKIPTYINQLWGTLVMLFTNSFPTIENKHILKQLYREKRPAMFVANHNSWMDIPYMGHTVGWRNYKIVSKKELGKVPILGKAIRVCANIMVDRLDRKSQVTTLKKGIEYLKKGVHLCTFPEGTRTKSGRLGDFKNGAFKMAFKANAPVVPLSIVNSGKIMPVHWMFPMRASSGLAKVVVHLPIESSGRTEAELATEVKQSILEGLPEEQRPINVA